ncbi:MAG: hypothetical protein IJH35_03785 [Methanobrevibacter sp.]|nr:hypothetical protein [Methanobrevibacter sp.]
MANEITAELNDEQFKKYQIMEENNMSVGELIDLVFYLRDQYGVRNNQLLEDRLAELAEKRKALEEKADSDGSVTEELEKVILEMDVVEKLTDTTLDVDSKIKILEKEYAPIDETYEMKVQAHKRGVKWGKFFDALK